MRFIHAIFAGLPGKIVLWGWIIPTLILALTLIPYFLSGCPGGQLKIELLCKISLFETGVRMQGYQILALLYVIYSSYVFLPILIAVLAQKILNNQAPRAAVEQYSLANNQPNGGQEKKIKSVQIWRPLVLWPLAWLLISAISIVSAALLESADHPLFYSMRNVSIVIIAALPFFCLGGVVQTIFSLLWKSDSRQAAYIKFFLAMTLVVASYSYKYHFANLLNDWQFQKSPSVQSVPSIIIEKNEVGETSPDLRKTVITPTKSLSQKDSFGSAEYTNHVFGWRISYPNDPSWVYSENGIGVSFGPYISKPGGYYWTVSVYDKTKFDLSTLISRLGSQYPDRREVRQNVVINGMSGHLVTVTTDSMDGRLSRAVYFEDEDKIFVISGQNSNLEEFEQFYSSFSLIE